jgi:threonyl-tRNA synthetase
VIVHRAILGSVERFMAILIEHLAGKWPYFISPRQAIILPLSEKFIPYCDKVYKRLHHEGVHVDVEYSNQTLNKKIRNAQLDQYNFILVCGEQEVETGTVDIRTRDSGIMGKMQIHKFVDYLKTLEPKPSHLETEMYSDEWKQSDYPELTDEQLKEMNKPPPKAPKPEGEEKKEGK